MRRREFLTMVGGAAASLPLSIRAQPATPVVGFLSAGTPEPNSRRVTAFRNGLNEVGYVDGRDITIAFRWADKDDQLPELAADLVRQRVAVIATPVSTQAALAAKAATTTIPIVFAVDSDPVALGLVANLNRPGGNVTGIRILNLELMPKRLGLLRELAPQATHFAALVNPNTALTPAVVKSLQAASASLGISVDIFRASTDGEIEAAFTSISQRPGGALLLGPDAFFTSRRAKITALAASHALPTMYVIREFADAGGLISYGSDIAHTCEQVGTYAGRILAGEKPADLPVVPSEKFEMVINLAAAKALGLTVPPTMLADANQVIE